MATSSERTSWSLQDMIPHYNRSLLAAGFSTVLIAAAGNIINDYFDTRIDRINKPDEVIRWAL
ncbi:MAG: hypothetical protein IPI91_19905 [Flavobacteriales bacterium]|nr:hypothetical protein [Flavobacteriales bacterium]